MEKTVPSGVSMTIKSASLNEIEDMLKFRMEEGSVSSFSRKDIRELSTGNYIVTNCEDHSAVGFVSLIDYPSEERSVELYIFTIRPWSTLEMGEIISEVIYELRGSSSIDNIFIKVSDDYKELAEYIEEEGFSKEGIFISNKNAKKEFSTYALYRFRVNKETR